MCCSHGASLLSHCHPRIVAALARAAELGVICAYETEHHVALAQLICELVSCAEMVRFAGTGTETVMHALRLVRATTGRDLVIKFGGHFHGYADALNYSWAPPLERAGPPDAPRPTPSQRGCPAGSTSLWWWCPSTTRQPWRLPSPARRAESLAAFRAAYEPLAAESRVLDAPGVCSPNLRSLPWRRCRRPICPLDLEVGR